MAPPITRPLSHRLSRHGRLPFVAALIAAACSDAASPKPEPQLDIHLLALETFDGSGQAVHPDAAVTPLSWGASETELFATPYPNSDASKENPSLYGKRSLALWRERAWFNTKAGS